MNSKFFAKLIIFLSLLLLLQSIIFAISYITLIKNKPLNFFGITSIQKNIYFKGYRKIWKSTKYMKNNKTYEIWDTFDSLAMRSWRATHSRI